MSSDSHADQSYYGQPLGSRQLVIQMQGSNAGADPLRDLLTRYGSRQGGAMPPPPAQQQSGYAPAYPQYQPQGSQPQGSSAAPPPANGYVAPPPSPAGRGPVQEQSLTPPSR